MTLPWSLPKLVPEIVTLEPMIPLDDDMAVTCGLSVTVKVTALSLKIPAFVRTRTLYEPALIFETEKTIDVSDQLVTTAVIPLMRPKPWMEPKLVPEMVTFVPPMPLDGEMAFICGGGVVTVKATMLSLAVPALLVTVTPHEPALIAGTVQAIDVADQLVTTARAVPN